MEEYLRCTAYTLQLIIDKGLLDELEKEIALQNKEEVNEQDEQNIIDPGNTSAYLHIITNTPTCWNFSYLA
ncbi:hypothetical protein C1646_769256 [Rhizophagus diaphanus]|nr:hypothetical protein C1646_769256 [Rhizophagus diaphanus] [Rhizophagus sp. MUCL 43196]